MVEVRPYQAGSIDIRFHDFYDNIGLKHSKQQASIFIDFSAFFFHDDVASASQRFLLITTGLLGLGTGKRMVGERFQEDQKSLFSLCVSWLASRQRHTYTEEDLCIARHTDGESILY